MRIKHINLPPIDVFPKTPQLKYLKPQPIGKIEIGYKFDEFKIRLEILNLQAGFIDSDYSHSRQRLIEKKLRELEKDFNKFIKTIHSPTVINPDLVIHREPDMIREDKDKPEVRK